MTTELKTTETQPEVNYFDLCIQLGKQREKELLEPGLTYRENLESNMALALYRGDLKESNRLFEIMTRMDRLGLIVVQS